MFAKKKLLSSVHGTSTIGHKKNHTIIRRVKKIAEGMNTYLSIFNNSYYAKLTDNVKFINLQKKRRFRQEFICLSTVFTIAIYIAYTISPIYV